MPDFTLPFDLETNVSTIAIGAFLSYVGHPLAFFSKKLSPRMQVALGYTLRCMQSRKPWRNGDNTLLGLNLES